MITGLDAIPVDERPPATIVHLAWDTMVGTGTALVVLATWGLVIRLRRRDYATARWFLRASSLAGFGAILALEAGWIVTEVGRQPWVVYGYLRTADAVTHASGVRITFIGVVVLYSALGVATLVALFALKRRWAPRTRAPTVAGRSTAGARRSRPVRSDRAQRRGPLVTAVQATAVVLLAGVTAYAVFGGADFGAGFWDLAAGRTDRTRPRALIADAIGPVWEANHTWLIFDLVILWTAFPPAFAAIMTTLFIPLSLVALGMVLRARRSRSARWRRRCAAARPPGRCSRSRRS